MKNFNIKTIGLLLKYDMTNFVKPIFWKLFMIDVGVMAILIKKIFFRWNNITLVENYITNINGVLYGTTFALLFAALLFTTKSIHDKLINKTNAQSYYMLPASILGKNIVIHITYIIMALASLIIVFIDKIIISLITLGKYPIITTISNDIHNLTGINPPKLTEIWMPFILLIIPTILLFLFFYYRIKEREVK